MASVANAGIHKKILNLEGITLIILHKEMENFMKIVKSFEDPGLLIKGKSGKIDKEVK